MLSINNNEGLSTLKIGRSMTQIVSPLLFLYLSCRTILYVSVATSDRPQKGGKWGIGNVSPKCQASVSGSLEECLSEGPNIQRDSNGRKGTNGRKYPNGLRDSNSRRVSNDPNIGEENYLILPTKVNI